MPLAARGRYRRTHPDPSHRHRADAFRAQARHRNQLGIALPVLFCLFVAFTGLSIFFLSYLNIVDFVERFSLSYLSQAGDVVLEKTINHISPLARIAELSGIHLEPDAKRKGETGGQR